MDITREQLASALKGFYVTVRTVTGTCLIEIADPDGTASAILAELGRMAALRKHEWCPFHDGSGTAGECNCELKKYTMRPPRWIEITRDELAAFLAKLRVGIEQREEWKMGPTARLGRPEAVADVIASHSRGLRLCEASDDVVDAHICCEHVPDDLELSAMAGITRLMGAETPDGHAVIRALYPLDGPALVRVTRWLLARFPAEQPS